jgi:hypothetical protein
MKQALIIAAVLITIAPTQAQLRDGAYSWSDVHSGKSLNISLAGNEFSYSKTAELESATGAGKFKIFDGKLLLIFDSLSEKVSDYKIVQTKAIDARHRSSFVELTVFDVANNNVAFDQAFVFIQGEDGNMVEHYTDSLGKLNFSIWNADAIKSISITAFGYGDIIISIDELLGKDVKILCYLGLLTEKVNNKRVIEYKIEEVTSNGFTLIDKKGRYALKRR